MSVSHKKINGLIEKIINSSEEFKVNNETITLDKNTFTELCKGIYLLESSTDSLSRSEVLVEIRKDILWHADRLIGK